MTAIEAYRQTESEDRFRRLTMLSADWYWEQDENLRFTAQHGGTRPRDLFSPEDIGKTRWELQSVDVSEAQWQAHRDTLAARLPFHAFELERRGHDGRLHYVSISGEPVFDAGGRFAGYHGVGSDITARKRAERLAELQQAVARLLAGPDETSATIRAVMQRMCEAERWDCGRYWRLDPVDRVFRATNTWTHGNAAIESFFTATMTLDWPGVSMAGTAARTAAAVWVTDMKTDPRARDADLACAAGLRSACAFPVAVDGEITGVFAFLCSEVRGAEDEVLAAAMSIASQVGQFLQRRKGEERLLESEARYRAFTELSSDVYGEQDLEHRFTLLSGSVKWGGGLDRDVFLGRTRREIPDVHWDEPELSALEALLDSEQPFRNFEIGRTLGSGEKQYLSLSGAPMYDADGRCVGHRNVGTNITARRRVADQLRESEARYRALSEMSTDWYWEHDEHQRLTRLSDHVLADRQLENQSILGRTRWELDIQYDAADRVALEADIEARRPFRDFRFRRIRNTGTTGHYVVRGEPMYDETGRYCGYRGVGHDVTERVEAESAVIRNSVQQGLIARLGQKALAFADASLLVEDAVRAVVDGLAVEFCSVVRYAEEDQSMTLDAGAGWSEGWLGSRFSLAGPSILPGGIPEQDQARGAGDPASDRRFAHARMLAIHDIQSGIEVLVGGSGAPYGILGCYSRRPHAFSAQSKDFLQSIANVLGAAIERRRTEERLAYMASYDSLTGLANRELFRERLEQCLLSAQRNRRLVGVLYLDLDGFKAVNDTCGHEAGDRLLALVAERLLSCVRQSDTVGRQGGDEFSIVLSDLVEASDASFVAQQIALQLARPFQIAGVGQRITASVGVAIYPRDGIDAKLLIKHADTAMYRSKTRSRNKSRRSRIGSPIQRRLD